MELTLKIIFYLSGAYLAIIPVVTKMLKKDKLTAPKTFKKRFKNVTKFGWSFIAASAILLTVSCIMEYLDKVKSDEAETDLKIAEIDRRNTEKAHQKSIKYLKDKLDTSYIHQQEDSYLNKQMNYTESLRDIEQLKIVSNLSDQNTSLDNKIGKYQKDIELRNERIQFLVENAGKYAMAISTVTNFDGSQFSSEGGMTTVTDGTKEYDYFIQFLQLQQEKKFEEMIYLCDNIKTVYTKWYTPYYFKAIALLNLDIKKYGEEALGLLEHIENNVYGFRNYHIALATVYSKVGMKKKADELTKNYTQTDYKSFDRMINDAFKKVRK